MKTEFKIWYVVSCWSFSMENVLNVAEKICIVSAFKNFWPLKELKGLAFILHHKSINLADQKILKYAFNLSGIKDVSRK